MLFPKRTKYRKMHRRDSYRKEHRVNTLTHGDFGIKSLRSCRLTAKQLEATRKTMVKKMKRMGRILLRVFPDVAITSKPAEVRMGKGKGSLDHWCSNINSGRILFEFQGISRAIAYEAAKNGVRKLPMQTKFVNLEKSKK
jgi:large subunit ribosomal protein L16